MAHYDSNLHWKLVDHEQCVALLSAEIKKIRIKAQLGLSSPEEMRENLLTFAGRLEKAAEGIKEFARN